MWKALILAGALLAVAAGLGWQWAQMEQKREHRFDYFIREVAGEQGVDPLLIRAVVWRESRFDPTVVGTAKERGLMQVTPIAAEDWVRATKREGFALDDLFKVRTNLEAGTWYLARAIRRWRETDNPLPFALAEYNAGRTHALRWVDPADPASAVKFMQRIDYPTTKRYIEVILEKYQEYQSGQPTSPWLLLWERLKRKL